MHRVIKRFNDRYTGQRYDIGQRFESSDPGRIDGLVKRGFLREEHEARPRGPLGRFQATSPAPADEGDSP